MQRLRNLLFIGFVSSCLLCPSAQAGHQSHSAGQSNVQTSDQISGQISGQASPQTSTAAKNAPIDVEVNKKQAGQKLVFKLAFSPNSFQQAFVNAIESAQLAYHRLGRYIENLCQGIDNNLKINNHATPSIQIAPKHMAQIQSHVQAASHAYYAIDHRIKTLAER